MSLATVPKTNWTSKDGVQFTAINEIGANLQALEDSKYESGDNINVGDITACDLTTGDITADSLTPTTMTADSIVITNATSWTPSAGFYIIEDITDVVVQIDSSGFKITRAGSFFTEGSVVRVRNDSGGDVTLDYLVFR